MGGTMYGCVLEAKETDGEWEGCGRAASGGRRLFCNSICRLGASYFIGCSALVALPWLYLCLHPQKSILGLSLPCTGKG